MPVIYIRRAVDSKSDLTKSHAALSRGMRAADKKFMNPITPSSPAFEFYFHCALLFFHMVLRRVQVPAYITTRRGVFVTFHSLAFQSATHLHLSQPHVTRIHNGHSSRYYPSSSWLNLNDRTRTGCNQRDEEVVSSSLYFTSLRLFIQLALLSCVHV